MGVFSAGAIFVTSKVSPYEMGYEKTLEACRNSLERLGFLEVMGLFRIKEKDQMVRINMDVSKNSGTPKSSILIGFSMINHPFWGTPNFWKHPYGSIGLFLWDYPEK